MSAAMCSEVTTVEGRRRGSLSHLFLQLSWVFSSPPLPGQRGFSHGTRGRSGERRHGRSGMRWGCITRIRVAGYGGLVPPSTLTLPHQAAADTCELSITTAIGTGGAAISSSGDYYSSVYESLPMKHLRAISRCTRKNGMYMKTVSSDRLYIP